MVCWLTTENNYIVFGEAERADCNQGIIMNFIPRRTRLLVATRCDDSTNSKLDVANDARVHAPLRDFSELVAPSISELNTTGFTPSGFCVQ